MEADDLDAIELTARDASRAINVPYSTLVNWLDSGRVKGRQTVTLKRYVTVGALREFLRTRGEAGEAALPGLEEYVRRYVKPNQERGAAKPSTDVLSLI